MMKNITLTLLMVSCILAVRAQDVVNERQFGVFAGTSFHYESFSELNRTLTASGLPKTDDLVDKAFIGLLMINGNSQYKFTVDHYTTEKTKYGSYTNKLRGWGLTASYGYNVLSNQRKSSLYPQASLGWRTADIKAGGDKFSSSSFLLNVGIEYIFRLFTIREVPAEMSIGAGADVHPLTGKWSSGINKENPWGGNFGFSLRVLLP